MTSRVLQLLADTAAPLFRWERGAGNVGGCWVEVEHVDGFRRSFALQIEAIGQEARAKERVQTHLPPFCPERHINLNGTFCLFGPDDAGRLITDAESARKWWNVLYRFLQLQRRAERKRKWPNNVEWAHGNGAKFQAQAEAAARALFSRDPAAALIAWLSITRIERGHHGRGPILRLYLNGQHLYSVWEHTAKVLNRRRRCFCGMSGARRAKRLRRCGNHAEHAGALAVALHRQQEAEQIFWRQFNGRPCCLTCDECPLRKTPARETVD